MISRRHQTPYKRSHACAVKPEVLKSWSLEIDYSRAPCLGADEKARGLWERDWPEVPQRSNECACLSHARAIERAWEWVAPFPFSKFSAPTNAFLAF